ncbi:SAM-dependent methyltransferase [Desulfuromonas acetexigens]|uniref:Class I SAM-dependent methyltransferase n=1 Tax=Trichloromonas acetexigens TaxID=38815 RepID=A0A550J7A0_9BACT|nr:class I SAM-dependent methyltransferase [Desulfuromonas acetexigens]TRO79105.1 class I SAM-dependent methyltransferase [Desulfuromonas acetexigens]
MWDQRYAADEYVYGKKPNDFLAEVSGRLAPGKVLCLAEGEGRNAVFLAGRGHAVTAVDASAVGLEKARKLAAERGVEIAVRVADLADFAIAPASWDAVVAIFCHLPPDLRRLVHRRVVDGLRPGGRFILEAYTPRQLQFKTGGPPTAELLMTLADLKEELTGLDFEIAEEIERDIHEGHCHFGRGAVARILGRKP